MFTSQYTPSDFQPSSGHITYKRWMGRDFTLTGEIIGERQVTVRRHHAVVIEYLVKPDPTQTNLSRHIVDESDVVMLERCPRCNNTGVIAVRGDDSVDCPVCGDSGEVTF